MTNNYPFRELVKTLVTQLVNQNYEGVIKSSNGDRLSPSDIKNAVNVYGRKLVIVMPPDSAFDHLDAIKITGAVPNSWSLRFPLWTKEENQSDLTLEMTVRETPGGYEATVDDLHVL